MADNLYIFDKGKNGTRHLLGEIQSNFNMSFVIDGTKDSAQVVVLGFQESEPAPDCAETEIAIKATAIKDRIFFMTIKY